MQKLCFHVFFSYILKLVLEIKLCNLIQCTMLEEAGFPLTKWCANNKCLLEGIPEGEIEKEFPSRVDGEATVKTLGILVD